MKKTLKVRLYPDKKQEAQFLEFSNIARFVYNETLAFSKEFYKNTNKYPTLQEMIDHIKELKYGKFPWILNAFFIYFPPYRLIFYTKKILFTILLFYIK